MYMYMFMFLMHDIVVCLLVVMVCFLISLYDVSLPYMHNVGLRDYMKNVLLGICEVAFTFFTGVLLGKIRSYEAKVFTNKGEISSSKFK